MVQQCVCGVQFGGTSLCKPNQTASLTLHFVGVGSWKIHWHRHTYTPKVENVAFSSIFILPNLRQYSVDWKAEGNPATFFSERSSCIPFLPGIAKTHAHTISQTRHARNVLVEMLVYSRQHQRCRRWKKHWVHCARNGPCCVYGFDFEFMRNRNGVYLVSRAPVGTTIKTEMCCKGFSVAHGMHLLPRPVVC